MPLIEVTLVQGRTAAQLRALITGLTDAAESALGASRPTVRVVLREVPETHWAAGDVTIAERNQKS
jgi:4-oxalocrotonate tautomerase